MKFDEHILKSKNILITGASKGIGRELSIGFSKYGANVILLGRNENELNEVYDQIKTKYNTNPMIILSDLADLDETSAQNLQNAPGDESVPGIDFGGGAGSNPALCSSLDPPNPPL